MLTLFYAPNTCALASRIALEEVGAAYETVLDSFQADCVDASFHPSPCGRGRAMHRPNRRLLIGGDATGRTASTPGLASWPRKTP